MIIQDLDLKKDISLIFEEIEQMQEMLLHVKNESTLVGLHYNVW